MRVILFCNGQFVFGMLVLVCVPRQKLALEFRLCQVDPTHEE